MRRILLCFFVLTLSVMVSASSAATITLTAPEEPEAALPPAGTGTAVYYADTGKVEISGNGVAQIGVESPGGLLGLTGAGDVTWLYGFGTLHEADASRAIETSVSANMPAFEDHLFFTAPTGITKADFDFQVRYQVLNGDVTRAPAEYIPEPGTLVLLGAGAGLGLLLLRRR